MATPRRTSPGKTGRRRTVEQAKKDAEALNLHCQGFGYQQIAEKMGWKGKGIAWYAVKRALGDLQRDNLEQLDHFAAAVETYMSLLRHHQSIIDKVHYATSASGAVVTMTDPETGEKVPVLDDAPRQRSMVEIRQIRDKLDTLLDLKPPAKSRVEVVTEDVVDREIAKLAEELANAQKSAAEKALEQGGNS